MIQFKLPKLPSETPEPKPRQGVHAGTGGGQGAPSEWDLIAYPLIERTFSQIVGFYLLGLWF